jgi:hypothetical protein
MDEAQIKQLMDAAESLALFPRMDELEEFLEQGARSHRLDWELAPIWARNLVTTMPKVFEHKYPELQFVNGEVAPIESVDPADLKWEYFEVDYGGSADFIDDDGHKMPALPPMRAGRHEGRMRKLGASYEMNMFDEERWAKASSRGNLPGINLLASKQKQAKRAHDAITDWLWAFGNGEKGMPGLLNHPSITVDVAALNAGASSRLPENKTAEENERDFSALIDQVAEDTLELYHAATVWLPHAHQRVLRNQYIDATASGMVSVWSRIVDRYKGDDTGQGKITFKLMHYADSRRRLDPRTVKGNPSLGPLAGSGSDTSGLSGNFMFAMPPQDKEELSFIRAMPYKTLPPREVDHFNTSFATISKVGGVKIKVPRAVKRLDYGLT